MKSLQGAMSLGLEAPMVVETPLMWLDKEATWSLAESLGGDALIEIIKINKTERNLLYIVVVKIEYIVKHNILFTPLDED